MKHVILRTISVCFCNAINYCALNLLSNIAFPLYTIYMYAVSSKRLWGGGASLARPWSRDVAVTWAIPENLQSMWTR